MTIRDYVNAKVSGWSYTIAEKVLEAELQRVEINPEQRVSDAVDLSKFWYNVIPDLLLMPKSISEGGFSISYDTEGLKAFYRTICSRLGLPDVTQGSTIKDISAQW